MLPLDHPLRRAQWIWPTPDHELHNQYAQFRYDFKLPTVPDTAPLFITADQQYMLYVNGHYAGRGPARGYQANWPFDEIDVAPLLRPGHNWLSVIAYNAGISTFQYIHQRAAGLLVGATWGDVEIATGPQWIMRADPAHVRYTARLSMQINFQEQLDARLDDRAWITSARSPLGGKWGGYDDPVTANAPTGATTGGWVQAHSHRRGYGVMPWHSVEPRGLPNLTGEVRPYARTVLSATGPAAPDWPTWENVAHGFHGELGPLTWADAPQGRKVKDGLAFTLPASGKGKLSAVLLDMGRPVIGTLLLDARGARGGEALDVYFTEAQHPDGTPVVTAPGQACCASMAARVVLREGRTRCELFQGIGHRFVVAIVRGATADLRLTLALRHSVYPLDLRGSFECDDAVLNDVHRISVQTQQVCALDSYVDTPWREQAQWWGDARVQAWNTFHLSADARLLARGIRSVGQQEVPNGLTYGHAPTIAHTCILPDFTLTWLLTLWDHYWQTGETELFREQWPRAQRALGYFATEGRGDSGLLVYDRRYWLFLDWTNIHKEGAPALLNLWYLLALDKLSTLAEAAGMKAASRQLASLARRQKAAVREAFWDAAAGLFRDGLTWEGKPVDVHSVHTQTLAILCGLRAGDWDSLVEKRILPYLRDEEIPGAKPSSYWVTYVYEVARSLGHGGEALAHLRRHWEPMIPFEGTWETFGGAIGTGGSCTHAWAAHPIYHLAGELGGVVQTDVAWRSVRFRPRLDFAAVGKADVVFPTPQGDIRSSWQRDGARAKGVLSLPKGVIASVELPGQKPRTLAHRVEWEAGL